MKRTTAAAAYDVPERKVPVPEYKIPISKIPGDTKVVWHSDPGLLAGPRDEEVRRRAPEMKFLYIISACLTLMVLWGIFREAKFRLPYIMYGSKSGAGGIADQGDNLEQIQLNAESEIVEDPISTADGIKEAKHFLEKYPYSLGTPVTDWDKQRQFLKRPTTFARKQPGVFLVSGSQAENCVNPMGDHYLLKFLKNRVDYSRMHGIRHHFYNMASIDEDVNTFWVKLPLLRSLMLEHPGVEWFWWISSDALFTNMTYEIPFNRYKKYNFIIQGNPESVYMQKRWSGLHTGVFLIRNCQWSLDFLEAWARMADKEFEVKWGSFLSEHLSGRDKNLPAEDQSAAVYLLAKERSTLAGKVFMENSNQLTQHWKSLEGRIEGIEGRWPFITHFAGCQFCNGTKNDVRVQECKDGMERAFNFADNQVLVSLGFQHADLSSHSVRPVIPSL